MQTHLTPVLVSLKRVNKSLAKQLRRWRYSLEKTFRKRKNQRRAIYTFGAVLILSLFTGLINVNNSRVDLQHNLSVRQAKLKQLDNELKQTQNQKAQTEAEVKARDVKLQDTQKQIEALQGQLQAKKQRESLLRRTVAQIAPQAASAAPSDPGTAPAASNARDIQGIITAAANEFGADPNQLLRIAKCESGLNPRASNGTHFGLFQFNPITYTAYAPRAGAGSDYWNATNNARTAAYMIAHGQASQWSCK